MITKGRNTGRIGTIVHRDRRMGSPDIVQIKDSAGHTFATLFDNVFVLGTKKSLVSLPKSKGVKLSIAEEVRRSVCVSVRVRCMCSLFSPAIVPLLPVSSAIAVLLPRPRQHLLKVAKRCSLVKPLVFNTATKMGSTGGFL